MSQRVSGYARQPDEAYDTPAAPVRALAPFLRERGARHIWDPAAGAGNLVRTLRAEGFTVTGTTADFFTNAVPTGVDTIVTNPPFGFGGRLAVRFIERAITTLVPVVAMLLRVDFDSGRTRVHLFRNNPHFAQKHRALTAGCCGQAWCDP